MEEEGHARRKACAACKYVRRKCDHNCIFAPYFPQGHETQFNNALKLYGVGKISKMIRVVRPPLKDHTMKTIMFESDMRALDPVAGCYALSQHLSSHIQNLSAELESTRQQLALLRGSSSSSTHSQSQELPNVVDPNSEGICFIDWEALQELIRNWANHVPGSQLLTLEDKKEEDENNEKSVVLDLINKIK